MNKLYLYIEHIIWDALGVCKYVIPHPQPYIPPQDDCFADSNDGTRLIVSLFIHVSMLYIIVSGAGDSIGAQIYSSTSCHSSHL